jgi:hypothetical protein
MLKLNKVIPICQEFDCITKYVILYKAIFGKVIRPYGKSYILLYFNNDSRSDIQINDGRKYRLWLTNEKPARMIWREGDICYKMFKRGEEDPFQVDN